MKTMPFNSTKDSMVFPSLECYIHMFKITSQAGNEATQSAVALMLQRIQNNVNLEANDEEEVVKNVAGIAYAST